MNIFVVITVVLAVLKSFNIINITWLAVFSPMILMVALAIFALILSMLL